MKIKDIGEIKLIERVSRRIRLDRSVIQGIGDDAAVIAWKKDKHLLYACDMLVEDVHFRRSAVTPAQIGWKALGRNISDIAAMGGVPRYAVVSIGIDPKIPVSFVDGIYDGMRAAAGRFKVNIVGGDMSKSKKTVIDVSIIGEVEKKNLVRRSGAKAGDLILVTGSLGGSIRGKHVTFVPRVDEARWLVNNFRINSMIDISDGLLLDLRRILEASGAGALLDEALIPVSKAARSLERAITDGEDFELLFTMDPVEAERLFRAVPADMSTPITLIGQVTNKKDGYMMMAAGRKRKAIKGGGYQHFL
ncbi:MAG: thiamine-phosphate kinase [Candidatus Omnitrophica bacterium]|nr:thiamine-phosphate kinase [Candidatus Omnitrophota bacterium]